MKILYGVQTTGNGHLTRSAVLVNELKKKGQSVDVLLSGDLSCRDFASNLFPEHQFLVGPTLVTYDGRLHIWKTIKEAHVFEFIKSIREIPIDEYDLVITDFEPITAWAARLNKKMSIGISNQYVMLNKSVRYTNFSPFSPLIDRFFAPVKVPIALHWRNFSTQTLPPILPCQQLDSLINNSISNNFVVYLPAENTEQITQLLTTQPEKHFKVFYPGVTEAYVQGNLQWLPLSREYFLQCLAASDGLIANAGFSTVSEAIYLGKKLLVKPLKNQLEQLLNSEILSKSDLGSVMYELSPEILSKWLSGTNLAKNIRWPNVSSLLAEWIIQGDYSYESLEKLHQQCW